MHSQVTRRFTRDLDLTKTLRRIQLQLESAQSIPSKGSTGSTVPAVHSVEFHSGASKPRPSFGPSHRPSSCSCRIHHPIQQNEASKTAEFLSHQLQTVQTCNRQVAHNRYLRLACPWALLPRGRLRYFLSFLSLSKKSSTDSMFFLGDMCQSSFAKPHKLVTSKICSHIFLRGYGSFQNYFYSYFRLSGDIDGSYCFFCYILQCFRADELRESFHGCACKSNLNFTMNWHEDIRKSFFSSELKQ